MYLDRGMSTMIAAAALTCVITFFFQTPCTQWKEVSELPESFTSRDFYTYNSIGATCGTQTRDLLDGNETFYQLN